MTEGDWVMLKVDPEDVELWHKNGATWLTMTVARGYATLACVARVVGGAK
jgi:hypothetical protein